MIIYMQHTIMTKIMDAFKRFCIPSDYRADSRFAHSQ